MGHGTIRNFGTQPNSKGFTWITIQPAISTKPRALSAELYRTNRSVSFDPAQAICNQNLKDLGDFAKALAPAASLRSGCVAGFLAPARRRNRRHRIGPCERSEGAQVGHGAMLQYRPMHHGHPSASIGTHEAKVSGYTLGMPHSIGFFSPHSTAQR